MLSKIVRETFVKLLSAINEVIFFENKVSVDSAAVLMDVEIYSFILLGVMVEPVAEEGGVLLVSWPTFVECISRALPLVGLANNSLLCMEVVHGRILPLSLIVKLEGRTLYSVVIVTCRLVGIRRVFLDTYDILVALDAEFGWIDCNSCQSLVNILVVPTGINVLPKWLFLTLWCIFYCC